MSNAVLAPFLLLSLASAFCRGRIQTPRGEQVHLPEAAQLAGVELCLPLGSWPGLLGPRLLLPLLPCVSARVLEVDFPSCCHMLPAKGQHPSPWCYLFTCPRAESTILLG